MKLGNQKLFQAKGIYFIADIHGDINKLKSLWEKIKKIIKPEEHLVFLGDYIGPNGSNLNTLLYLNNIKKEHNNTFFIEGNHDDSLKSFLKSTTKKEFLDDDKIFRELEERGYSRGNRENLLQYINENKISFLNETISYYETEDILATHAPLDGDFLKTYPIYEGFLDEQEISFGILNDFIPPEEEDRKIKGIEKWLICGHQNNGFNNHDRKEPSIYEKSKRIFLDSGCGYREEAKLYCFHYPSKKIISC